MGRRQTQVEKEEGPRSFAVFLDSLEDGDFARELSKQLHDLGLALDERLETESQACGSMTVSLNFKADKKAVEIKASVSTKHPVAPRAASVCWLTPGSNFSPVNPRQQELPLWGVEGEGGAERPAARSL